MEEGATRRPDPHLLRDAILMGLREAGLAPRRIGILSLQDDSRAEEAGDRAPPSAPDLLDDLVLAFQEVEVGLAPPSAIRMLLERAGPDSEYLPRVVADLAGRTDAENLVRVALVHYASTMIREQDRYAVNEGLYRLQRADFLTLRLAITDSAGEMVWIDEVRAVQSRDAMYWDREGEEEPELVEMRVTPFGGEPLEWHAPVHAPGDSDRVVTQADPDEIPDALLAPTAGPGASPRPVAPRIRRELERTLASLASHGSR